MGYQTTNNESAWESEYQNPQLLTLGTEPVSDVKEFFRELRRKKKIDMTDFTVLDLGCGNGKNIIYAVENFCKSGIGYDFSKTAIDLAKKDSGALPIHYEIRSIAEPYPLANNSVDIILDITSSNSLNSSERSIYLSEMYRVLKSGGWLLVRTLCLDGDKNAKKLIAEFPGSGPGTYILPNLGIHETVFSEAEFKNVYESTGFHIKHIEKKSRYQKWGNQSYKRNYWVVYLQKKLS